MLSESDRSLLLALAREQIEAKIQNRPPLLPGPTLGVRVPSGAFVTLHSRRGHSLQLRGCIGHIEAVDSLYDTVKQVSLSAAFNDYRFPPLARDELDSIELEISVLTPFVRVKNVSEVQPGTHGLFIRRGHRSGLLLPQVATERNWDRDTFLSQTCLKAGLPEDSWRLDDTEIHTFSAEVFGESRDTQST